MGSESSDKTIKLEGASLKARPDGSLAEDPPPLTLADVARSLRGSPEAAVLRLWFLGQWGSAPSVVELYEPTVRTAVGASTMAGGYAVQRAVLLTSRPRIAYVTRTGLGALVGVEALRRGAPPLRDSFLLRRHGSGWLVLYDTVLERAFAGAQQFSSNPNPSAEPERAAVREGHVAAARFRGAYLRARRGLRGGRRPARGAGR
jgi:hypothetical protein